MALVAGPRGGGRARRDSMFEQLMNSIPSPDSTPSQQIPASSMGSPPAEAAVDPSEATYRGGPPAPPAEHLMERRTPSIGLTPREAISSLAGGLPPALDMSERKRKLLEMLFGNSQ